MLGPASGTPPIAHVAGEASVMAALQEVTAEIRSAVDEGRIVQRLPLDAIVVDHLMRDRLTADTGEMAALRDSIRAHGQRTPIEVVDLQDGRYGLISGWRRLTALEQLAAEDGGEGFGLVLALLRQPETMPDAYVAMVEENEIRAGLSFYERARVVARAVEQGVFPTEKIALQKLFATASRAKRSKIGSFLTVYHALDGVLKFPAELSERQGLSLARLLDRGDHTLAAGLRAHMAGVKPRTAADEQAALKGVVARLNRWLDGLMQPAETAAGQGGPTAPEPTPAPAPAPAPAAKPDKPDAPAPVEIRPGVFLENQGGYLKRRLVISGDKVNPQFQERLEYWLRHGK